MRWRKIKSEFTQLLKFNGVKIQKNSRGEHNLWQPRFWEHTIRNNHDYENHINYIHFNPVKHGLVNRASEWPYSSFHRYVKNKLLTPDWGWNGSTDNHNYGE